MAREDSSASPGRDPFNENSPPSDGDPYSSSTTQPGLPQYHIDDSKHQRPIPIIGPLIGYNRAFYAKVNQGKLESHAKFLQRPPTQEEAEAITYWGAKQISIFSYGTPLGIAAGIWRARTTLSTFRFPFWEPNLEKFNAQVFPTPKMPYVTGNRAVLIWQILRHTAYGVVGKQVGDLIFGSYSMTVAATGEVGDSRLKAMREVARRHNNQAKGGLPGLLGTTGSPQGRSKMGQRDLPPVDDASPTGGMFQEESIGAGSNIGSADDDSRAQQPQPSKWPQQSRSMPIPTQQTQIQGSSNDPFDYASSTGEENATAISSPSPQQQQQTGSQTGSAWDRIRQTAGKSSSGTQAETQPVQQQTRGWSSVREQATGAGSDDAFSQGSEDRNMARTEAQKEFDDRIERERRGGDFSSGDGDQKRW